MERDIKRPNLRILYSPAGSFSVYFSKTLSSFVFDYTLHAALLLALVPILHISFGSRPGLFLLLMAPVELAAASFGTFFCCLMHTEEAASTLLSTLVSLMCVVGGSFFPLDGMGGALAFVTRLSPAKWVNEAFFLLSCDNSARLFVPVAAGALATAALLMLGCRVTFRTEDYL